MEINNLYGSKQGAAIEINRAIRSLESTTDLGRPL